MANLYYKNADKLFINESPNERGYHRVAGEGIPSYQKKMGVENPLEIANEIVKIELGEMSYTSGAVQYGAVVDVILTTSSGHKIFTIIDASKCFDYIKKYGVTKKEIHGSFLILFKGVTYEISEKDSKEHISHVEAHFGEIEKEQKLKAKNKKIVYEVGKTYKINRNDKVYFGEYFLRKPRITNEFISGSNRYDASTIQITKPTKYHVFLEQIGDSFKHIVLRTNSSLSKCEVQEVEDLDLVSEETINKFNKILAQEVDVSKNLKRAESNYSSTGFYNRTNELRNEVRNAQIEYLVSKLSKTKDSVPEHDLEDLKLYGLLALNNPVV